MNPLIGLVLLALPFLLVGLLVALMTYGLGTPTKRTGKPER
jgi:hypothetical protein